MLAIFILAILIVILVALVRYGKDSTIDDLEKAILQADKTGDHSIVENYCSTNRISDDKYQEVRRALYFRLAEEGDLYAMNMAAAYSETAMGRCRWLTKCAEAGDAEAMYSLALGYSEAANMKPSKWGFGLDPQREFYWYKCAADKGHGKAMECIASCYLFGTGVEKNKQLAFDYAKNGAERGFSECSFFLVIYFAMQFEDPHLTKAEIVQLMERVMLRGERESFAKAAYELGNIYGSAFLYNAQMDEYSDRRKAAYYFTLAYVLDDDLYDKKKIVETGYNPSQIELNRWRDDALNLRFNP